MNAQDLIDQYGSVKQIISVKAGRGSRGIIPGIKVDIGAKVATTSYPKRPSAQSCNSYRTFGGRSPG